MEDIETLARKILDVSFVIHRELGPGLLESVYESVLYDELIREGYQVEQQKLVPVIYKGNVLEQGFRADLIVEKRIILELKSVEELKKVHFKQLLTYLRLTNTHLGFILNFGSSLMKDGIVRVINSPKPQSSP